MVRATLLTLAPVSRRVPVLATRLQSRVSSLGVVQRSPLHRTRSGNPTPGDVLPRISARPCSAFPRRPAPPSRWERLFPSACRPRGFSPPRRFIPPRPCDRIAGRCRSWGSQRFFLSRNRLPRCAPAALRSFPSADSCGSGTNPGYRGFASPPRSSPIVAFTANLAFSPFLSRRDSAAVSRASSQ